MPNVSIHITNKPIYSRSLHEINRRTHVRSWTYFTQLEDWVSKHIKNNSLTISRIHLKSPSVKIDLSVDVHSVLMDRYIIHKMKEHFEFLMVQKVCGYDPENIHDDQVTSLLKVIEEIELDRNENKYVYFIMYLHPVIR